MKNQEIVKGLKLIAEGFTALSQAFEDVVINVDLAKGTDKTVQTVVDTKTDEIVSQKDVTPEPKQEPKKGVEKKVEEQPKAEGLTRESLNALSYNEIKALAKENGVKAVGSKAVIIDNILATVGEVQEKALDEKVAEKEPEEIEEETTELEEDIEMIDETEEDEEEVAEEEEHSTLYDTVAKDLEDYTDEELADILSDVGLSPKGKRQALLAKIVQAIEEGVLEWEEESASEETEEVAEVIEDTEKVEEEEYDFVTEARKSACMKLEKEIRADFKAKKITNKEIVKFLKNFDEEFVSGGVESDLEDYIYVKFNLVDEDGELHELSDPYYIGETVCCCGQELSELEEDEFVCEICGESYTL